MLLLQGEIEPGDGRSFSHLQFADDWCAVFLPSFQCVMAGREVTNLEASLRIRHGVEGVRQYRNPGRLPAIGRALTWFVSLLVVNLAEDPAAYLRVRECAAEVLPSSGHSAVRLPVLPREDMDGMEYVVVGLDEEFLADHDSKDPRRKLELADL